MKLIIVLLAVLLTVLKCITAYNILGIFPHPGKSHLDSFTPLMKGLAKAGHNITVISYYPLRPGLPNYRDIVIESREDDYAELERGRSLELLEKGTLIRQIFTPSDLAAYGKLACEVGFRSESLQNFLKEDNVFDVVVIEFFNTDCFLPITQKFRAATIGMSSCIMMPWNGYRYGNPDHPAYISNNLVSISQRSTFLERLQNTLLTIISAICYKYVMIPQDNYLSNQYFEWKNLPIEEYINNASMLLINTHFSLNLPRPLVPGIVEIGGIHIDKSKPLPQNLEKWISEAKHGVIYFSLGSMIKAKTMRKEKLEAFNKAFKRLPQRVLWKWENDTMEGKADNVMIQKWMPQFDILSHPNVKAFINHGGLLGTIEAVHCGVPMVVMPQFGDQHTNAKAIEANGGGIILKMSEVTEESVYNALKQVLSPDFQQQAKELSERFKDRPLPPLETAIYWVEYVARHKGAPHMRTAAVGMPFYQYYLLDVIGFLLIVTGLLSYILYHILKYPVRGLMRNKTVKEKSS